MFFSTENIKFDKQNNNIHLISSHYYSVPPEKYGGTELIIANLCTGLAKLGCNVTCYSPGKFDISGVAHWQTLAQPSSHIKGEITSNIIDHFDSIASGLKENLKEGDVIILNHAKHYRYLKRILSLFQRHKYFICEIAHWTKTGVKKNIIYPSASLKSQIAKPGVVIPHGIELQLKMVHGDRENFLFYAGRINKSKGLDLALTASKKLKIQLILAGPIDDKSFSKLLLAENNVILLGELNHDELFTYYSKAKALIYMTQYTEPFGIAVIEAMAAGCPVITTGKGGTGETALNGETGYFCETVDDICKAYGNLNKLNPQKCVNRAKNYNIDNMARSYLDYFLAH